MSINRHNFTLTLWGKNIPNYIDIGDKNTEIFRDNLEIYTIIDNPEITVFLPSKKNSTGQAVLIIPGGGYEVVVHEWEGYDIAKWLNSQGIAGIVLKYRLPHSKSNIIGHRSPLIDAIRAIRTIRFYAKKWGIDEDNIGVMGFSAGGHISAMLGTHFDELIYDTNDAIDNLSARPDFMILIYPVITMSEDFTQSGSKYFLLGHNPGDELTNYYSCEKNITEKTPSTFIVHSTDDKVVSVENSIAFYKELIKNKIDAEMHIFNHGEHGFALANGAGRIESWKSLCIEWLRNCKKQK